MRCRNCGIPIEGHPFTALCSDCWVSCLLSIKYQGVSVRYASKYYGVSRHSIQLHLEKYLGIGEAYSHFIEKQRSVQHTDFYRERRAKYQREKRLREREQHGINKY